MTALPEIKNPLVSGRVVGDNVSYEEYAKQLVNRGHKDFVMTRGELCDFKPNAHKWINGYHEEEESTAALEWGHNFEELICYPERKDQFILPPEKYVDSKKQTSDWTWKSKTCRAWRTEQEKAGKIVVEKDTWTQLNNAVKFFWACPEVREFVRCSRKQVMVEANYQDKETGIVVPIKTLIDLVPPREHEIFHDDLGDLKTAANSHPHKWQLEVYRLGLHVQAALYLDAWNIATGETRSTFRHPICESPPPWETSPYMLDQEFITIGRMFYFDALKRYCQCLATNSWPGYATQEHGKVYGGWLMIGPKPWMVMDT